MAKAGSRPVPFLTACEVVRERIKEERWRLSVLGELGGWAAFVVCWQGAAPAIRRFIPDEECPETDTDEMLGWCWQQVDDYIDPLLAVIDSRCMIPGLAVVANFEALRSSGLIFPDGKSHPLLLDRLAREQNLVDLRAIAEVRELSYRAIKATKEHDELAAQGKPPTPAAPLPQPTKPVQGQARPTFRLKTP